MTPLGQAELDAFSRAIAEAREAGAEARETFDRGRIRDLAHELASLGGVSQREAGEAVDAAIDVLEWRLGCAPPQRVFRLARAMIEHESKRQGDLFTERAAPRLHEPRQ